MACSKHLLAVSGCPMCDVASRADDIERALDRNTGALESAAERQAAAMADAASAVAEAQREAAERMEAAQERASELADERQRELIAAMEQERAEQAWIVAHQREIQSRAQSEKAATLILSSMGDEAAGALRAALELDPANTDAVRIQAMVLRAAGRTEEGAAATKKLVSLVSQVGAGVAGRANPAADFATAASVFSELVDENGTLEIVERRLVRWSGSDWRDGKGYALLGALILTGHGERVLAVAQQLAERHSDHFARYVQIAALEELGRTTESTALAVRIVEARRAFGIRRGGVELGALAITDPGHLEGWDTSTHAVEIEASNVVKAVSNILDRPLRAELEATLTALAQKTALHNDVRLWNHANEKMGRAHLRRSLGTAAKLAALGAIAGLGVGACGGMGAVRGMLGSVALMLGVAALVSLVRWPAWKRSAAKGLAPKEPSPRFASIGAELSRRHTAASPDVREAVPPPVGASSAGLGAAGVLAVCSVAAIAYPAISTTGDSPFGGTEQPMVSAAVGSTPTASAPQAATPAETFERLRPSRTSASSFLTQRRNRYAAKLAFDGNRATAWNEGAAGSGQGEWIEARFAPGTRFRRVEIGTGWDRVGPNGDLFPANAHARRISIQVDGREVTAVNAAADQRYVTASLDATGATMRFVVLDVWPGERFEDLCINEIVVEGTPGRGGAPRADEEAPPPEPDETVPTGEPEATTESPF